jgi:glucuronokinase
VRREIGRAFARAGLLGNPSDQYEGKAIALSVCNFAAEVVIEEAPRFEIERGPSETLAFDDFRAAVEAVRQRGCDDAVRLLRAAIRRFADHVEASGALAPDDPRLRFRVRYATSIPRQVGLAGSSAIVVATLRALSRWFATPIAPDVLAELALAAELEDLGIPAGPMDRVIQSYEGLLYMDFEAPRSAASYERLDPVLLPPLFVAWEPRGGDVSGKTHGDVRSRWLRGDPEVRRAMAVFPRLAEEGRACLERRDFAGLRKLVDQNFDTRASIYRLRPRDVEMVHLGRAEGAAVKFAGSGGAVLGILEHESAFERIERAYAHAGFRAIRPVVVPPAAPAA